MTIAYWCVFISILLPLLYTGVAKFSGGDYQPKHNLEPREFLNNLEGFRQRANWTQLNTHESIPAFMAAVIIAHQIGGEQASIDVLAVFYIVLRLVYGVLYILNKGLLRTLTWTLSLLCILGLFFTA
jgi:uncharacterized MAPEG superfamily protein